MKVKKVYCPFCRRLIKPKETKSDESSIIISCPRCQTELYNWNGLRWRWKRHEASDQSERMN